MSYAGRCPICSGVLNPLEGYVICEHGDFKAPIVAFNNRWVKFEDDNLKLTETLLEDLKVMNEVVL